MKLIISESQAISLMETFGGNLTNRAIGFVMDNPTIAKSLGVPTSPTDFLSPEMADRFKDVDFEKDAPNLSKFFQSIKNIDKNSNNLSSILPSNNKPSIEIPTKDIPTRDGMAHPLGNKRKITSMFGKRNSKVGSKNHGGVDFGVPSGSPVYSPLDGVVVRAEDTSPDGCGGHVRIRHNKKIETKFCHLKQWSVEKGQKVKKGDIIGYSGGGRTDRYRGISTGSHLHYEIVVNGKSVDPLTIQKNLV